MGGPGYEATHDSGRVACVSAVSYFTVVSDCSCRNGTIDTIYDGTDAPIGVYSTKMFFITSGRSY